MIEENVSFPVDPLSDSDPDLARESRGRDDIFNKSDAAVWSSRDHGDSGLPWRGSASAEVSLGRMWCVEGGDWRVEWCVFEDDGVGSRSMFLWVGMSSGNSGTSRSRVLKGPKGVE